MSGLAAGTGVDGFYKLNVKAFGVRDRAGNSGTNEIAVEWRKVPSDPPLVQIPKLPVAVTEKTAGMFLVPIVVGLSHASASPVSVDFKTRDGVDSLDQGLRGALASDADCFRHFGFSPGNHK